MIKITETCMIRFWMHPASYLPATGHYPLCFCIGYDDRYDVLEYLGDQQAKCYEIGSALKLDADRLDLSERNAHLTLLLL